MEVYSLNEDKSSIFNIDVRIMASIAYILLIIFRLFNNLKFIINIEDLMIYDAIDILMAYLSTFVTYYDLLICIIPVLLIIFEKKSKLIKFHSYQYLILNLFIPMIYVLLVFIVFSFMGILQLSWTTTLLYLYFMMMLYGLWAMVSLVLQVIAVFNVYKFNTSGFILISNLANKLAKL